MIEYGDVPAVVGGGGSPAFVLHPMSLATRSVFGAPLEVVINYVMMCPLVHLPPAARARCYEIRDALAAGSPWEAERVALVDAFAEASGLGDLLATARVVNPLTGARSAQRVAYGVMYTSLLKHFPSAKLQVGGGGRCPPPSPPQLGVLWLRLPAQRMAVVACIVARCCITVVLLLLGRRAGVRVARGRLAQARGTGEDNAYMGCKGPHPGRLTGGAQKYGRMEEEQMGAQGCAFAHAAFNSVSSDSIPRLVCRNPECGTLLGSWGACPVCAAYNDEGTAGVTMLSAETERLMHLLRVIGLDMKLEIKPIAST